MLKKRPPALAAKSEAALSEGASSSGSNDTAGARAIDSVPVTSSTVTSKAKIQIKVDSHGMFSSLSTPSLSFKEQQQQQQQQQQQGQQSQEQVADSHAAGGGSGSGTTGANAGSNSEPHRARVTREEVMSLNSLVIGSGKQGPSGKVTRVSSAGAVSQHQQQQHSEQAINKSIVAGRLERVQAGPLRTQSGHVHVQPKVTLENASLHPSLIAERSRSGPVHDSPLQAHLEVQRAAALQRVNSRMAVSLMPNSSAAPSAAAYEVRVLAPPQLTSVSKIMAQKLPAQSPGAGTGTENSQEVKTNRPSAYLSKIKRERLKERCSFSETFPKARGAEDEILSKYGIDFRPQDKDRDAVGSSIASVADADRISSAALDPLLSTTGGIGHLRRTGVDHFSTLTTIDTENGVVLVDLGGEGDRGASSPKIFVPPISVEAIADKGYAHSYAAPTSGRRDGTGNSRGAPDRHDGMNTFPAPNAAGSGFNITVKEEARARENDRVITERLLEAKALDRNKRCAPGATMHKFSLWGNGNGNAAKKTDAAIFADTAGDASTRTGSVGTIGASSIAVSPTTADAKVGISGPSSGGDKSMHSRRIAREAREGTMGNVDKTPPRPVVPAAPAAPNDLDKTPQMQHGRKAILSVSAAASAAQHPQPLSRKLFEDEITGAAGNARDTKGMQPPSMHSLIMQADANASSSTECAENGLEGSPSQGAEGAKKGRVASALRNIVGNAKSQQLEHSPQKAPRSMEKGIENSGHGASRSDALAQSVSRVVQQQAVNYSLATSPITEESNILTSESEAALEVQEQLHTARSDKTGGTEGSVEEELAPAEFRNSTASAAKAKTASPQQVDSADSTFNPAQFSGGERREEDSRRTFAPIQVDQIHMPSNLDVEDPDALLPLTERSGYSGESKDNHVGGSHSHGSNGRDAALSPTLSELSHGSDDENEGEGSDARKRTASHGRSHAHGPGPAKEKIVFREAPTAPRTPFAQKPGDLSLAQVQAQETPQAGVVLGADAGGTTTTYSPLRWKRGALIGEGTFGKVYKGMNERTGELLAVKQLSLLDGTAEGVEGLQKEISVMWHLDHANIVRYLGTARSDRYLFIVIEYVSGGSISNMLQQFGPFVEKLIRRFTLHILSGVKYLHDKSIIHRDIKGGNVLVTNAGVAKLADFGCSKQLAGMCTASMEESMRAIRGSVPWMAPEVIKQSGHGCSSDIWSVGATVIEMGTGKPPWPEFTNNLAALFHVATSKVPPPAPSHLSSNCASFLSRCMAIEPDERATAAQLLASDPFILSNSPHAQAIDSGNFGFNSPVDTVGVSRGVVTASDEKHLSTPRTDMQEKVRAAYENSIAVSQLLFPDEDDDQLSVASSIVIDAPLGENQGKLSLQP